MPTTAPASKRQFPLHVHISVMFTLLLIVLGVTLGIFNYLQTTRIILNSSQQLFQQIERDVQQDLQHTYQPIRHALRLLALNANTGIEGSESRMALLEPFVQTLKDNPSLAALYLGDAQGNFFLVRPLRSQAAKDRLSAPSSATYEAWNIQCSGQDAAPLSRHFFYDDSLTLVGQRDKPDESYDPRQRSWFIPARGIHDEITTSPYLFFSTREVGTTVSRRSSAKVVIGADLTLSQLSATLARHKVTPHTEIALFDQDNTAIAYPDYSRLVAAPESTQLPKVDQLSSALSTLIAQPGTAGAELTADQRQWIVSRAGLTDGALNGLQLALMVPKDELLADAYRLRWQGALVTLGILLLCLPVGWLVSRVLVKPLRRLVQEAEAIRRFDFNYPASPHSPVLEIDQLASSMRRMKETLASFFEITASLSAHTRFEPLLQSVVLETMKIAQAQAGLIYLIDNDGPELSLKGLIIGDQPRDVNLLEAAINADPRQYPDWLRTLHQGGDSVVCTLNLEQAGMLHPVLQALDTHSAHLLGIRLHNRHGETVGILVLLLNNSDSTEDREHLRPDRIAFIQAVSGAAAVSIESQRLQARQKQLLDAFIQLLAGAIDAKSPYTGSHCQRVPALTLMLAQAASSSQSPEFEHYRPTDEEWEALHIASWLHDCGKVTTPEYVVDKATKLETLYDRIHEVRTRFEVLKRDAWVNYWQSRALGGNDQQLTQIREAVLAALDDDFAFVARCNLGGEAMAEDDLQRLQTIALRTWTRTLDDRLGVSWEENKRQTTRQEQPLPVTEPLLADKPEHLFERNDSERIEPDNVWGFQLDVPAYKFNRGELYNLSTTRGTLTREERYIINNHIVQTILMLKHLPFPSYLGNIAEIAGGHHEKMDGTGYPKRLKREEMSLAARMMAIADIFEALTASDRPYKKGKTLSEALSIMAAMCHDAHIDPHLFALFIHEQIFMQYARRFLEPAQIDAVDVDALLRKAGLAA